MNPGKGGRRLILVGPDLDALGGIARVVRIWRDGGFFSGWEVTFISSSVTGGGAAKARVLFKGILRHARSLAQGDCLVYIHTADLNSFYRKSLFVLLSRLFQRKTVLHIHPSSFAAFLDRLRGFRRWYVFLVLRQVDLFVVLTEEMKAAIRGAVPGREVHLLRNAVDVRAMSLAQRGGRESNRLLYLGWHIREKGVYELVDAVEILKRKGMRVHLDLYGANGTESLREYVAGKELSAEVKVKGWIGDHEKIKALHRCTLLALPSHTEGLPNVVLEAMAAGTPIVATHAGGLKEILRDGENSVIAGVKDPRDLAAKIEKALLSTELRATIAANAFRQVAREFDVPVIREQFLRILERAAG